MTTNRSKKPIFKLEVTSRDINLRALRPSPRKVSLAILALLLAVLIFAACSQPDLRGRCLEIALKVLELAIGGGYAP